MSNFIGVTDEYDYHQNDIRWTQGIITNEIFEKLLKLLDFVG